MLEMLPEQSKEAESQTKGAIHHNVNSLGLLFKVPSRPRKYLDEGRWPGRVAGVRRDSASSFRLS